MKRFLNLRAAIPGAARHGDEGDRAGGVPLKRRRAVWFPESRAFVETPVYDRARLPLGEVFEGPALVEEEGSTLVVGPGGSFRVAPSGNIVVTIA